MNFGSTQQYDFFASLPSSTTVWKWSEGMVFLPLTTTLKLAPNETSIFRESWNQNSNADSQVTPGTYVIRGMVTNTPPPSVPSASTTITITSVVSTESILSSQRTFFLSQNYPNPFNPSTKIRFALPERANVNLSIYNLLGEKVTELVNGELDAGYHETQWNASRFASGVYFYTLQAGKFFETKKLILLK